MRALFEVRFSSFACALPLALIVLLASPPLQAHHKNRILKFVCPSPIIISGSSDAGSTVVQLTNDGVDPVDLALTSEDFKSDITGQYAGAQITLTGVDGKPLPAPKALKHGEFQLVKVSVSNAWQAGISEAQMCNDGKLIGTLRAIKYHFPFAVSLDLPNAAAPGIVAIRNRTFFLPFKNADALTYPLGWRLIVDGTNVAGGQLTLAPKATISAPVQADGAWFPSDFANRVLSALKPREVDGRIELSFQPQADPPEDRAGNSEQDSFERALAAGGGLYPTASIPVKIRLHYWPDKWQSIWGYLLIGLIVLAGSLTSLLLSYGIPNVLSRLDLKGKLTALGTRVAAMSSAVDSRLRVQLGTQSRQINDGIRSRYWFSPDQPEAIRLSGSDLASLEQRVALTEDLDSLRQRYESLIARNMPPTLRQRADVKLQTAADLLTNPRIGADDVTKVQLLVHDAGQALDQVREALFEGKATPALLTALGFVSRVQSLKADFAPLGVPWDGAPSSGVLDEAIVNRFKALRKSVEEPEDPSAIQGENLRLLSHYVHQDFQILKLELLRDYAQLYAASGPNNRERLNRNKDAFLPLVDGECWGDLQSARLVLSGMQCNVYPEDLESAVRDGKFTIVPDRAMIERNQAVRFSVRFDLPELNGPAALEQLDYAWEFIHPWWDRSPIARIRSWVIRTWERDVLSGILLLVGSLLTCVLALIVTELVVEAVASVFPQEGFLGLRLAGFEFWLLAIAPSVIAAVLVLLGTGVLTSRPGRRRGAVPEATDTMIREGGKSVWFAWHYFPNAHDYLVRLSISGSRLPTPPAGSTGTGLNPAPAESSEKRRSAAAGTMWRYPSSLDPKDRRSGWSDRDWHWPFLHSVEVRAEGSKPMQRAGAEFLRFFLAFSAALITLILGARSQIVKLDLAAAIAALWTLGFTSDAMKNLISQGPAASVAAARRADGPSPGPAGRPPAPAPTPGPVIPKNGGTSAPNKAPQAQTANPAPGGAPASDPNQQSAAASPDADPVPKGPDRG